MAPQSTGKGQEVTIRWVDGVFAEPGPFWAETLALGTPRSSMRTAAGDRSGEPMKGFVAGGILSLAVVAILMSGPTPSLLPDAEVCRFGQWDDAEALSPVGTLLRSPDLGIFRDRPLIAGLNLPRTDSVQFGQPFFLGSTDPQESLGRPAGEFQFLNPRIVVEEANRLHMVWAEAQEPLSTGYDITFPVLTELWYAVYSDGQWSSPVQLFETGRLFWNREQSDLYFDPTGDVLSVLYDTFSGPTVLQRAERGPRISTDTVFGAGDPIYMDIVGRGAALYVVYLDWSRAHGGTRVQVVSSSDSGRTWSTPVVLDPDTQHRPSDSWVFLGSTGELHVLWIEVSEDSWSSTDSLHHSWRESGSTQWQMEETYPLPEGLAHVVVTMDRCGGFHLVGDRLTDQGTPRLAYVERRGDEWVEVEVPVAGTPSMEPALLAYDDGIYLAWSEVDGATGMDGIRVMVARRPIRVGR